MVWASKRVSLVNPDKGVGLRALHCLWPAENTAQFLGDPCASGPTRAGASGCALLWFQPTKRWRRVGASSTGVLAIEAACPRVEVMPHCLESGVLWMLSLVWQAILGMVCALHALHEV